MLLSFGKEKNTIGRGEKPQQLIAKLKSKISFIDHYYIAIIIVLAALAILAWSVAGCCQARTSDGKDVRASYLKVGDKMPDVVITNIINAHYKTTKISDYKGKLILLDFWSTWCSACIEGFSELDSLQRRYTGKIQVFLVNPQREHDTEKGVKIVLNRMNEWSSRPFKLPIVFKDTSVTKNFSFHSLPHCIWIGPDGTVVGITGKEEVTARNIEKALAGEHILPLQQTH